MSKEVGITKANEMTIMALKTITNEITEIKTGWMGSIWEWK